MDSVFTQYTDKLSKHVGFEQHIQQQNDRLRLKLTKISACANAAAGFLTNLIKYVE